VSASSASASLISQKGILPAVSGFADAKNLVKNTLNKRQTKMKNNRKKFNKDSFVINVLARDEL
jgi:hypothetical protein